MMSTSSSLESKTFLLTMSLNKGNMIKMVVIE